ncbi:PAS domain S-box protein [Acetobacterium sp.]|uniref:sensor domain-containing diguanylate cyclase n=1 Tax=Acetobacterium sp. TaxID=1872094 RepID=UPI003593FDA9
MKTEDTQIKPCDQGTRSNEARLRRLVDILKHPSDTIQEFLDYALKQAIELTESRIGYIYHYSEETCEFVLNTWSEEVMEACHVEKRETTYQLDKTGIWGEAVRQRQPIVINAFKEKNPLKKGYPKGHVPMTNFLTIPVFKNNQIVGVVGLANKETDYDETDIFNITLLMEAVWTVTESKKAELALAESNARYDKLVQRISVGIYTMRIKSSGETQFEYCSEKFCEMLGLTKAEVLGNTEAVEQAIHPDDRASLKTANQQAVRCFQSFRWEGRSCVKGETHWIRFESEPTLFPNGDTLWNGVLFDISERKQTEAKLKESEERFKALHNASFGGIAIHDLGVILECNQGLAEMTQYAMEELIGMNGLLLIAPEYRELVGKNIASGYEKPYEAFGIRKNGELFPIQLEARNIPYKGKTVRVVEFRDITKEKEAYAKSLEINRRLQDEIIERKYIEEALRSSEEKLKTIIETSPDGLAISTMDGIVEFVTAQSVAMWGYDSSDEMIGRNIMEFVHENYHEKAIYFITEMINGHLTGAAEYLMVRKDGSQFYCETNANILKDKNKNAIGVLHIERDITERKILLEELKDLAIKDQLTGLYNRRKIDEVLMKEKAEAESGDHHLSVIMVDIDMFKLVNDQHGHLVGDQVLTEITEILTKGIRRIDVLGRWGGEEFIIICTDTDLEGATVLAEKLRKLVAAHDFNGVGKKTCSFGVAQLRKKETIDELLLRSDLALYRAKERGRNRVEQEVCREKQNNEINSLKKKTRG